MSSARIFKPGKPAHEVSSCRPISLLPILLKVLERIIQRRMNPIIDAQNVFPDQFGFRKKHSPIEQCNRVYSIARDALEKRSIVLQSSLTLAKLLIKFGIQDFYIS